MKKTLLLTLLLTCAFTLSSCSKNTEEILAFQNEFRVSDTLIYKKKDNKFQLNLREANYQDMIDAGVLPEHITITKWCTGCHPDLLWSHRKNGNARGSLAAFLCLK